MSDTNQRYLATVRYLSGSTLTVEVAPERGQSIVDALVDGGDIQFEWTLDDVKAL